MKTFKNTCAQGDIYFTRIDVLPDGAVPVDPENGVHVVAHSETGHHHVMDADTCTMYRLPDSIMDCFLVVKKPTALRHLRDADKHKPIMFEKGIHHGRRQRESTPGGFRMMAD